MIWLLIVLVILLLLGGYFLFRNTLNKLQYIGFLFWITKDDGLKGEPILSYGFMRQTSPPWKIGRGIQVRVRLHTFQIGFCRSANLEDPNDEVAALEYILSGYDKEHRAS